MSKEVLHVGRKSFMAYVRSAIGTAVWLAIWGAGSIFAAFNGYSGVGLLGAGVCLLVAARGVYNLFYLRTMRWELDEEGLRVRWGILPWARSDYHYPYETIFEAYYTFGFFAKLLGYGDAVIRRTEGLTSAEEFSHMHDPGASTRVINEKIKELRQVRRGGAAIVTGANKSEVEQLAELAKLKSEGAISGDDFERMKAKIVGSAGPMPDGLPRPDAGARVH